jgi:hypothetical protein
MHPPNSGLDAKAAVQTLVAWISGQSWKGQSNFTAAVCNGNDLVISAVGGIPGSSKPAQTIRAYLEQNGMHAGREVYWAQPFSRKDGPASNHAEMCILAACQTVNYIKCVAPNCALCKATLKYFEVESGNEVGAGRSQMGWRHPFLPVSFGTQVGSQNLGELEKYNKAWEHIKITIAQLFLKI